MSQSPVRAHLPALAIILVMIISGVLLLPSLPDEIPVHFDSAGTPDAYGPSIPFVIFFSLSSLGMVIFLLLSDIFLVYPILPGKLMGAVNAVIAATMSVVYATALAFALEKIENINTCLPLGFLIVLVVCVVLYSGEVRRLDESVSTLGSPEYFEKTRPAWFYYLFFIALPLIPRYLLLSDRGIGILGALYRVTIPWHNVETVTAVDITSGNTTKGLPVKIYHTFTNLVMIRVTGKKASIIISPKRREEYLRIVGDFLAGKPGA